MYDDWASLAIQLDPAGASTASVLCKLPADEARRVVMSVVKTVALQLGLTSPRDAKPSPLAKETEVVWFMEVICYGLSLPLSEHDTIKDCVNVYCEWLSALLPEPKTCVPTPLREEPNRFSRMILQHLYHIFVPRKDNSAQDSIHRQAVLCHRVLRRVQDVAKQSDILEPETWESLLCFLLAINDALLSPPTVKDDVGDQLCERVLGVLYEIWLVACVKCFPTPSLWKTFRDMSMHWRHRTGLVDQWNKVTLALTSRVLNCMYGPGFPQLAADPDNSLVPAQMNYDCIAQTWFRFLHSMGNPVDLSRPSVISQTQAFYQYAIVAENVIDPANHPCLSGLPNIFLRAMRGISAIVDAFLGIPAPKNGRSASSEISSVSEVSDTALPHPARPKCDSILHLVGMWLFEAAFIGSDFCKAKAGGPDPNPSPVSSKPSPKGGGSTSSAAITSQSSLKKAGSISGNFSASTLPSLSAGGSASLDAAEIMLTTEKFESGQAEALGVLCRIFCSKKTTEDISPMYLARFYLSLQQGLNVGPEKKISECLAAILINSHDLLRVDLDGISVIIPSLVSALEAVLEGPEMRMQSAAIAHISKAELRRAAIHLLVSMIALPLHFQGLPIKKLFSGLEVVSFWQLRFKISNLVFSALQYETDAHNAQLLLGALLQLVQDYAVYETPCNPIDVSEPNMEGSEFVNGGSAKSAALSDDDGYAYVCFVRAIHLVCHRLISSWKSDLSTSLAAIELLKGLARANISHQGTALECKRAVKWLCDFILNQCSRPPPAHSKDLHSSIVSAFHCCRTWLVQHPYLLQDKESLSTVLEVVELGLSGSKSQMRAYDQPILKDEKSSLPASRRVGDAAESLLFVIFEQADFFPRAWCAESLSTLIDEAALMKLSQPGNADNMSMLEASQSLRYFVMDRSILIGILEEALHPDNGMATVCILIRGLTGRSCWTCQLRHLPRHKSGVKPTLINPGRPLAMDDVACKSNFRPSFFPDSIDRIPVCKADLSIPAVENVAGDERSAMELDYLSCLLDQHIKMSDTMHPSKDTANSSVFDALDTECRAPEPCHEFQTARLILSHLGLLNGKSLHESLESPVPQLVALDSGSIDFVNDLECLDRISPRTSDTVNVFYVRNGQTSPDEILSNVLDASLVHPHFLELLSTLGWPINVWRHSGWTGHVSTSWRVQTEPMKPPDTPHHGGSIFNGDHYALYWADDSSEVVFLVASPKPCRPFQSQVSCTATSTVAADQGDKGQADKSKRRLGRQISSSVTAEMRIMVAWLENFEDFSKFPVISLLSETDTDCGPSHGFGPSQQPLLNISSAPTRSSRDPYCIIFIHPLSSGLIRVKLQSNSEKITSMATPLVDGMVVSRRVLGSLVRQTALNIASRRRLELDCYQPPHVRRKLKIQEIVQKYRSSMSGSDFYAHLFARRFAV